MQFNNCNCTATSSANTRLYWQEIWPWGEAAYPKLLCFIATFKCFSHFCNYCITFLVFNNLEFFNNQYPYPAPLLFDLTTSYVVAWGNFCLKHWTFYTMVIGLWEKHRSVSFLGINSQLLSVWLSVWIASIISNCSWQIWWPSTMGKQESYKATGWGKRHWHHLHELVHSIWHTVPHNILAFELERHGLTAGCRTAVLQQPHSLSQSCEAAAISHILPPQYRLFLCNSRSEAVFTFAYFLNRKSAVTATVSQWHYVPL